MEVVLEYSVSGVEHLFEFFTVFHPLLALTVGDNELLGQLLNFAADERALGEVELQEMLKHFVELRLLFQKLADLLMHFKIK